MTKRKEFVRRLRLFKRRWIWSNSKKAAYIAARREETKRELALAESCDKYIAGVLRR